MALRLCVLVLQDRLQWPKHMQTTDAYLGCRFDEHWPHIAGERFNGGVPCVGKGFQGLGFFCVGKGADKRSHKLCDQEAYVINKEADTRASCFVCRNLLAREIPGIESVETKAPGLEAQATAVCLMIMQDRSDRHGCSRCPTLSRPTNLVKAQALVPGTQLQQGQLALLLLLLVNVLVLQAATAQAAGVQLQLQMLWPAQLSHRPASVHRQRRSPAAAAAAAGAGAGAQSLDLCLAR